MPTDTQRLNFLQELTERNDYTGRVKLRMSIMGRGWRLHETSQIGGDPSVRDAIDNFMAIYLGEKEE